MSSGPALVSILRQGSYLVASDHTALDDTEMIRFRNDLVDQIATFRSKGAIIDVAALDVLDSFGFTTEHRGQRQKAGSGLKSLLRPTRSRDARGTPTATLAVRRNRNPAAAGRHRSERLGRGERIDETRTGGQDVVPS